MFFSEAPVGPHRIWQITKKTGREVIMLTVVKGNSGPKNNLIKDKEAYNVETSEIDGSHGLPRDTISLANDLQQGPHVVVKLSISKKIKPSFAQRYSQRVIKGVNKEQGGK